MKKCVFIRVDANPSIGLGHVTRCLALAEMLREVYHVSFYTKSIPEFFLNDLIDKGFTVRSIITEDHFINNLSGREIIIVDHYDLGTDYQKKIKKKDCKLICIDDLHDKEFYADLIINHAPGVKPEDYRAQPYTEFALGLNYALLRPNFLNVAAEKKRVFKNNNLFICFGGSDLLDLTRVTLEVVLEKGEFDNINVVVGSGYAWYSELKDIISKNNSIKLFRNVNEEKMVNIMQNSKVAIVPSSGILLETLSVGLIAISGMYVENQKYIYTNYKKSGAFIDAKDFSRKNIIAALCVLNEQKLELNRNTIDGLSGKRIRNLI